VLGDPTAPAGPAPGETYENFPPLDAGDYVAYWTVTTDVERKVGDELRRIVIAEFAGESAAVFVIQPGAACGPRVLERYSIYHGGRGISIELAGSWVDPQTPRLVLLLHIERRTRGFTFEGKEVPASDSYSWSALVVEPYQAYVAFKETGTTLRARLQPTASGVSLVTDCGDTWFVGPDEVFHLRGVRRCPTD
jgi:hypothetical protein